MLYGGECSLSTVKVWRTSSHFTVYFMISPSAVFKQFLLLCSKLNNEYMAFLKRELECLRYKEIWKRMRNHSGLPVNSLANSPSGEGEKERDS